MKCHKTFSQFFLLSIFLYEMRKHIFVNFTLSYISQVDSILNFMFCKYSSDISSLFK